jgi:dihydrodipicolinate reductase
MARSSATNLTHRRAITRAVFNEFKRQLNSGAVRAALWLKGKKPGLYGMKDVLGL